MDKEQGSARADYLGAFGKRLTTNLREFGGSSLDGPQAEKAKPSIRERLSQSKLGKWILAGTVTIAGVAGGAEIVHQVQETNQAEFQATQAQIAPVIHDTMVDIDRQTLDEQRLHPENIRAYVNPAGHMGVTEFRTIAGNVKVLMDNTNDKPDPNKPLYIDYRNNVGMEGKNGTPIVMTSPKGNEWVDEATSQGATEFGGSTDGRLGGNDRLCRYDIPRLC
jgi:hypothetical protein